MLILLYTAWKKDINFIATFESLTYWHIDISKHLKGRSAPRVSDVFADSKDFVVFLFPDTFRIQGILSFPCFWTLSVFKGFCRFPVSRHFPYSRNFVVFPFPDTFRNQWPPCHSVPPVCFVVAQKMLSLPLFKVKTNLNRNTIRIQIYLIRNPHLNI